MKTAIRLFLTALGMIIFLWFFVPGLITANFHIGVLTGAGIGFVLLLYGIFFSQINSGIGRIWRHIFGKIFIILISAALCAIMALAGACIYHMADACRELPSVSDISSVQPDDQTAPTILVLGCRVYSYGPSLTLIERMNAAIDYLNTHPDASCIACGGQGDNEPMSEAQAIYNYLTARGIVPERIYKEASSTDTKENLANAARIIEKHDLPSQTVIATNDFHMYRAQKYAEDVGFDNPGAVSAPTLWWLFPSLSVREMYGIMEMWFLN